MDLWVRVAIALLRHPKLHRFAALLKVDVDLALGKIIRLWAWAAEMRVPASGDIPWTAEEIADVMRYPPAKAEQLVAALVGCAPAGRAGFLERTPDGFRLHDWADYAGELEHQRAKARDRKRRQRAKDVGQSVTVTGTERDGHALRTDGRTDGVNGRTDETNGVPVAAAAVRDRLTPDGQAALDQLLRASANPTALVAECQAVLDGMRPGVPPDPAALSLALSDATLSGGHLTGVKLRAFVQRAARPDFPAGGPTAPGPKLNPMAQFEETLRAGHAR